MLKAALGSLFVVFAFFCGAWFDHGLHDHEEQQKEKPTMNQCTQNAWSVINECVDSFHNLNRQECITAGVELLSFCENDDAEYEETGC